VEVVASLSQGRTAAAQCGLFTCKSVPVIFEPPCTSGPPQWSLSLRFAHRNPVHPSSLPHTSSLSKEWNYEVR